MYRSPTLWEDLVKTVCNTNIRFRVPKDRQEGYSQGFSTWGFNLRLCSQLGTRNGAFPTAREVQQAGLGTLEALKLGYRAKRIFALAEQVENGQLDLPALEKKAFAIARLRAGRPGRRRGKGEREEEGEGKEWDPAADLVSELRKELLAVPGIGPFGCENLLQLLGVYCAMPLDSETERLWREFYRTPQKQLQPWWCSHRDELFRRWQSGHGRSQTVGKAGPSREQLFKIASQYYRARYGVHCWLGYWLELWVFSYEPQHGQPAHLWESFGDPPAERLAGNTTPKKEKAADRPRGKNKNKKHSKHDSKQEEAGPDSGVITPVRTRASFTGCADRPAQLAVSPAAAATSTEDRCNEHDQHNLMPSGPPAPDEARKEAMEQQSKAIQQAMERGSATKPRGREQATPKATRLLRRNVPSAGVTQHRSVLQCVPLGALARHIVPHTSSAPTLMLSYTASTTTVPFKSPSSFSWERRCRFKIVVSCQT
eukprot:g40156.t1